MKYSRQTVWGSLYLWVVLAWSRSYRNFASFRPQLMTMDIHSKFLIISLRFSWGRKNSQPKYCWKKFSHLITAFSPHNDVRRQKWISILSKACSSGNIMITVWCESFLVSNFTIFRCTVNFSFKFLRLMKRFPPES